MRIRRTQLKACPLAATGGRRAAWTHELGEKGYALMRKARELQADSLEMWMQKRALFNFRMHEDHAWVFDKVDEILREPMVGEVRRVLSCNEFRVLWDSYICVLRVLTRWVGRCRLRWARECGDYYYTRLTYVVNTYALTDGAHSFGMPERGTMAQGHYNKLLDAALSRRWKFCEGADVFGEMYNVQSKDGRVLSTGVLAKKVLAQRAAHV
mmetsp:Transcript_9507/g.28963  ORF Transcript_9507/g.28963 Transcript_9507/m.28963 type:complete len:211 (+) Transcript_9507:1011-1643(+)